MRGASAAGRRRAIEQRALAYMTAGLMRAERLPDADEFISGRRDRAAEVRRWVQAWDRVEAAFARGH